MDYSNSITSQKGEVKGMKFLKSRVRFILQGKSFQSKIGHPIISTQETKWLRL